MAGGGSTSADQKTAITNIDKRQVVDGGSIGISADGGSSINVAQYSLDSGALERASQVAELAAYGSALTAQKVAEESSRMSTDIANRALDTAGGSVSDALRFAGDVASGGWRTTSDAFGFAKESQRMSLDYADAGRRDAFALATEALTGTTKAASDAANLAVRAYDNATQTAAGNRTLATTGLVIGGVVLVAMLARR